MATVQRRLSVIVAADVVGYSRLMGQDEEGTLRALKAHRQAIDPLFAEDGGRIVKTTGDGLLLEFPSAFHAVRAALGVQRLIAERNADVPPERRLIFRMGIHLGDVIVDDDDIFGDGVNIAARLQEIAEPGGICLSQPVHGTIHKNIDALFRDGGPKMLKNIAAPVHIFNLALDGSAGGAGGGVAPGAAPAPPKPAVPASPPLIAAVVLPFANLSGDSRHDYFVDSVTDHLIGELAQIESSFIVSRDAAFGYRGDTAEPAQIARALSVRFIVKGSVRTAGGRLRANAQLIDAEDGRQLWVDRVELAVADPFTMQHDIVSRMLPRLRAQLFAATGRAPPPARPMAAAAARPVPAPAPASRSAPMVVHPRAPAPAEAPRPAPATAARPPARAAAMPPAPAPARPALNPAASISPDLAGHRPWLWSLCLVVAAAALAGALVLAFLGVKRSLVIEAASWVLLTAGAVQLAAALLSRRRSG